MAIALSRVRTGRCLRFSTTSRWIKPLVYQVLGEPLQKHHHESGAEQYEGYSCPAPERIPLRGNSPYRRGDPLGRDRVTASFRISFKGAIFFNWRSGCNDSLPCRVPPVSYTHLTL